MWLKVLLLFLSCPWRSSFLHPWLKFYGLSPLHTQASALHCLLGQFPSLLLFQLLPPKTWIPKQPFPNAQLPNHFLMLNCYWISLAFISNPSVQYQIHYLSFWKFILFHIFYVSVNGTQCPSITYKTFLFLAPNNVTKTNSVNFLNSSWFFCHFLQLHLTFLIQTFNIISHYVYPLFIESLLCAKLILRT